MVNGFGLMKIDKKDKSINAHNIVTNSYSCGIGVQNLNALMMGNEKNVGIMQILNVISKGEELLSSETMDIVGGMDANTNEALICSCSDDGDDNNNDALLYCSC